MASQIALGCLQIRGELPVLLHPDLHDAVAAAGGQDSRVERVEIKVNHLLGPGFKREKREKKRERKRKREREKRKRKRRESERMCNERFETIEAIAPRKILPIPHINPT